MLTRRQSLLALLSLSVAPSLSIASPALAASDGRADKLVAGLYERILKNPDLPGFGVKKADRKLLSKSLGELWDKTEAKRKRIKDEMGPLGFDVVTNSQTGDLKSYDLWITELTARGAIVKANFTRGDEYPEAERKDVVEYRLVAENGWKMDEIRGKVDDKPWSLRELLSNYLNDKKF
jgi:hypothetical protein